METLEEDESIYSDDATLFISNEEDPRNITKKLHNYEYVTQTRKLKIKWGKALLLTNTKGPNAHVPTPYNAVKTTKPDTILGEQIKIPNKNGPSISKRIRQAKQVWVNLTRNSAQQITPHSRQ